MATTSTFPDVKAAIVTAVEAAAPSGVDVSYAWQPWGQSDQIFLGDVEGTSTIPTVKSGRKQRQESYRIDAVIRVVDADSDDAAVTEARAETLMAVLGDVLADDPQISAATAIQWAMVGDFTSRIVPRDRGRACEIVVGIEVEARLT